MAQKRFVVNFGREVPIVNMLCPRNGFAALAFTEAYMAWRPKFDAWKADAKKKWKAGESYEACPEFPDPNLGVLTDAQYEAEQEKYKKGEECNIVLYQPAIAEFALLVKAPCMLRGQASKNTVKPDNWPENIPWQAGYKIDEAPRRFHRRDISKCIGENAAIIIGPDGERFIVSKNADPTPYHISPQREGSNFGANQGIRTRLSLESISPDLIGEINRSIHSIPVETRVKIGDVAKEVCIGYSYFLPNQTITWGSLVVDSKTVTANTAYQMADTNGCLPDCACIFAPLAHNDTLWVGEWVHEDAVYEQIKTEMGEKRFAEFEARVGRSGKTGDAKDKSAHNAMACARATPDHLNCYGLPTVQCGIVPASKVDDTGRYFTVMLNWRTNKTMNRNLWDYKAETRQEEEQPAAVVEEGVPEPSEA